MIDYQELKQIEDDLWEAADNLRANSKLTASEYAMPVLGLIFLRHATTRFYALLPHVEQDIPARATGALREERIRLGFQGKAAIYLPERSRYDYLAALPAGNNLGQAIRDAMIAIEESATDQNGIKLLEGALPKDYLGLGQDTHLLAELIKQFNTPALAHATGDVFGRIYEYFLNKFAQSGAQEGGEFFTPPSLVRMIVNVIEPDHGIVLDPACGSAGMFVQTAHFIEDVRRKQTHDVNIAFYGQEKADLNGKLARMNMAVHGLEGKIQNGNTFYEDKHDLVGKCDFVMANPPFNVDGVLSSKIGGQVGENQTGRLPFGLPGMTGKSKNSDQGDTVSNANSLWIQYFYSYLNPRGRAGFVMASNASDAGNKDKEIRQKLVETAHVDVMISIGTKFFYTRSLPCMLWFYDKGKPNARKDSVLMIDARNVYTVVSARSHVFTDEQLGNLTAITWLYRGEHGKFIALLARYQREAAQWLTALPARLAADSENTALLIKVLRDFGAMTTDTVAIAIAREKQGEVEGIADASLASYRDGLLQLDALTADWDARLQTALDAAALLAKAIGAVPAKAGFDARKALHAQCETHNPHIKAGLHALEARHKAALKLLDMAEKTLRARQWSGFDGDTARDAKKALLPRDTKRREKPTLRDQTVEAFKWASYFVAQGHWLLSRFPGGVYDDVAGLCKIASRADIAANDYSLTPGRYVGVALAKDDEDDGEAFAMRMKEIHGELAELNGRAFELATKIQSVFSELFE